MARAAQDVGAHVLVGVDGSEASFEACRQAVRLAVPGTRIELVAVVHLAAAVRTGLNAPRITDVLRREAERALDQAVGIVGDRGVRRFVNGIASDALVREVTERGATLLVVGSHGHRRSTEILIGGVAGQLLHSAPCSLLVARPPAPDALFPRSLVVGVDGSAPAEHARAVAERLAGRLDVPLRVLRADDDPVDALVDAGRTAGLLVVGSRGLRGLRALGSVSERVAHRAACSVLVVRPERGE